MLTWRAGGAPPAGAGNTTSVFAAIRFHSVTALPAGWAWTGANGPLSATTSGTTKATIRNGMAFVIGVASALTRALRSFMTLPLLYVLVRRQRRLEYQRVRSGFPVAGWVAHA